MSDLFIQFHKYIVLLGRLGIIPISGREGEIFQVTELTAKPKFARHRNYRSAQKDNLFHDRAAAQSTRHHRALGIITRHYDLLLKFVEGDAGEGVDEGAGGGVEDLDAGGVGVGLYVEVGPERDGERFVKLMDMDVLI